MNNELLTNELLLGILDELYSIELILADVFNGKTLRYTGEMLDKDGQVVEALMNAVMAQSGVNTDEESDGQE